MFRLPRRSQRSIAPPVSAARAASNRSTAREAESSSSPQKNASGTVVIGRAPDGRRCVAASGEPEGRAGPAQAADLVRPDPGRAADVLPRAGRPAPGRRAGPRPPSRPRGRRCRAADSGDATRRTAPPSSRGAGRPACPRRRRSALRGSRTPPSDGTARRRAGASPGGSRRPAPAPGGRPWSATPPSRRRGGGARAGSSAGSALSASWSRAAASTRRRSTAIPRASIRAASQPATSATARACRTNQGGGSRESRREAASTRPGTVIASMVPDGRGTAGGAAGGVRAGRRSGRFGWRRRGRDQPGDRDRAQERGAGVVAFATTAARAPGDARRGRDRAAAFGPDRHPVRVEPHDDRPVPVGPEDAGARCREPIEGRLRRMPVRVAGAGRRDRDRGPRRHRRTPASSPSGCRGGRP